MLSDKTNNRFLVVGLGNPGKEYQNTPHNIGWQVILSFAAKYKINFEQSKKLFGQFAKIAIDKDEVILLMPTTYMNKSGIAVMGALRWWKIPLRNLLVIHDDSDQTLGKLKVGFNQGAGGHKGVASIVQALGSKQFTRLKLGIRPKNMPQGGKRHVKAEKFVLRPWPESTQSEISQLGQDVVANWINHGLSNTMNKYNSKH